MLAPKQNESFFAYWISFWPTAPFFGVAWRFEKATPFSAFFAPSSVLAGMARAGADEAAKAADEAAHVMDKTADVVAEAATASVEVVVEAATPDVALVEDTVVADEAEEAAEASETPRPVGLLDAAPEAVDDLKLIKGVGPKSEQMLNDLGVYTFAQIAALGPDDSAWIEARFAAARARPLPSDWVEQARAMV